MAVTGTPITTSYGGILGTLIEELDREFRETAATDSDRALTPAEWLTFLVEAEDEIARRAYILEDRITASVCQITLATSTPAYNKASSILLIERCELNSDGTIIEKKTESWLDTYESGWKNLTAGKPKYFIEYASSIRIVPAPSSTYNGDVLNLVVKRLPITSLSAGNTTPSVNSKYYPDMKLWAKYRAYSKDDIEIADPSNPGKVLSLANTYYQRFEKSVGSRPNANVERITQEESCGYMSFYPEFN